eukprot:CAMPEP_0201508718 /NCGR_PEP_ID=MMETSP0161_2-20130828/1990_1 /ASSEMBLY_ACC=CAM_ASM_000251 /TAXON_ID=180227 /ORGANISM="Neoparamoeba aestuarina, Strain SoJaBio B1-5/56/2" /LENGTH=611 /DNA_ID=CAMNT_0047903463 /DNA_START=536 /DNA_END=2371 /DNA_ORIENTATION=-
MSPTNTQPTPASVPSLALSPTLSNRWQNVLPDGQGDLSEVLSKFNSVNYEPQEMVFDSSKEKGMDFAGLVVGGSLNVVLCREDKQQISLDDLYIGETTLIFECFTDTPPRTTLRAGKNGCRLLQIPLSFLAQDDEKNSGKIRNFLVQLMWNRLEERKEANLWLQRFRRKLNEGRRGERIGDLTVTKPTLTAYVDDSKISVDHMVTWKDFAYVGTAVFFRVFDLSTSETKFQLDVGVRGLFRRRNLLLVALRDFRLFLYDMKRNVPMVQLTGHKNWVASVALHRQTIVSTSADKTAIIWDIGHLYKSNKKKSKYDQPMDLQEYEGQGEGRNFAEILKDDDSDTGSDLSEYTMSTSSDFGDIDDDDLLEPSSPVAVLEGHTETVVMAGFIKGFIVTASADKSIRLWGLQGDLLGKCLQVIENAHDDWITQGKVKDNELFTIARDFMVNQWAMGGKRGKFSKKSHLKLTHSYQCEARPTRLFVSKTRLFVPTSDNSIHCFDHKTGKLIVKCVGHTDKITSIVVGDDHVFWSGSGDKKIKQWSVDSGEVVCEFVGHTGGVNKFQKTGQHIVSASDDGTVRIWKTGPGTPKLKEKEKDKDKKRIKTPRHHHRPHFT